MGNREIANEQGVSINTIKTQLKAVYRKLGVHSRYAAMNYILKQPKSTDL
jgi:DNA-binding NarL/FixJ family response regulator